MRLSVLIPKNRFVMSKKITPTNKIKTFFNQVKTGFKTNKSTIQYPSEVHDIFQKRTTTT